MVERAADAEQSGVSRDEQARARADLVTGQLVLGGGAIGVELAQAFAQLGSRVTLVEALDRILTREEPEASRVLTAVLERSDVDVRTGSAVQRVTAACACRCAARAP